MNHRFTGASQQRCPEPAMSSGAPIDSDQSDAKLLESALRDAVEAHLAGVIVGPAVDKVALRRAERRARRADAARSLDASGWDGAA